MSDDQGRTAIVTGGVDVLVNNAAETSGGTPSITELAREDWERQFAVNLHAPSSLIAAVVPSMQARGGGVIVNVTSGAAEIVPVAVDPGFAREHHLDLDGFGLDV